MKNSSSSSFQHNLVDEAFSKSGASGLYDRARPTYPTLSIQRILSHLPNQDAKIVELGSGTGIFTRGLISHSQPGQISNWYALEPASGMREAFMKSVYQFNSNTTLDFFKDRHDRGGGGLPVISCNHGTFDRMDSIESHSVDMVVAAQAWHWTGGDATFQETCVKEVERVLKPGGYFVLIWNLKDREASDWVGSIRDAYEVYESDTPQYRLGLWKSLFKTPTFKKSFKLLEPDDDDQPPNPQISDDNDEQEPKEKKKIKNVNDCIDKSIPTMTISTKVPMTLEGLFERILSKSYITVLDDSTLEILKNQIQSIWNQLESTTTSHHHHHNNDYGIQRIDEKTVSFPYVTHVYIMQKK